MKIVVVNNIFLVLNVAHTLPGLNLVLDLEI